MNFESTTSESSDDGCSAVCTCGGEEGEGGGAASSSAAIVCRRNGGNVNIKESSSDDGINSGCSGESSRRSSTSSSSPSIGSAERVDGWVVSSESCAFTSIGAKFCRDVLPGEIVEISPQGRVMVMYSVYVGARIHGIPPKTPKIHLDSLNSPTQCL